MKMIKAKSSNIESIGYDEKMFQLFVEFKSSDRSKAKTFVYEDVSPEEYEALMNADSIGKHFSSHIKPFKECGKHITKPSKPEPSTWISVDDELPKNKTFVLGWVAPHGIVKSGTAEPVIKIGKDWYDMGDRTCTVTHWMPLPAPPTT